MPNPSRDIDRSGGPTPGDPTPEDFERLAEWADDPQRSPSVSLIVCGRCDPGYLLRQIAEAYREAQETSDE